MQSLPAPTEEAPGGCTEDGHTTCETTHVLSLQNLQDTYKTELSVPVLSGAGGGNRVTIHKSGDCKLQHLSCFLLPPPPSVLRQANDSHGPLDPLSTVSRGCAAARQEGVGLEGQGRTGHLREDVHAPSYPSKYWFHSVCLADEGGLLGQV